VTLVEDMETIFVSREAKEEKAVQGQLWEQKPP